MPDVQVTMFPLTLILTTGAELIPDVVFASNTSIDCVIKEMTRKQKE